MAAYMSSELFFFYHVHSTRKQSDLAYQYLILQLSAEHIFTTSDIYFCHQDFIPNLSPTVTKAMLSHFCPIKRHMVMVSLSCTMIMDITIESKIVSEYI